MVSNLEWVTAKENVNHGTKINRTVESVSKPIIHVVNGVSTEYKNAVVASEFTGIHKATIRQQLNRERITNKNNYFIYKNNNVIKYYYEYVFENKISYSITEMAKCLGVNRNTITRRIKSGLIKRRVMYLCDQEN